MAKVNRFVEEDPGTYIEMSNEGAVGVSRSLRRMWPTASGTQVNVVTGEIGNDPENTYQNCQIRYFEGMPCWFDMEKKRIVQWITLDDMIKCIPDTDPDFKRAFRKLDASLEHKHRVLKRIHANSKGTPFPAFRTEGAE